MERVKFFWKDNPYEVITGAQTKIEGEWIVSIVYCTLYNNKEGEVFVKTEKDEEWQEFNMAINQGIVDRKREVNVTLRISGRSTRMADNYIQELFEKGSIIVRDHYNDIHTHEILFRTIIERLKSEHPRTDCHIDKTKLQLTLVK